MITEERNKYVKLKQIASQTITELMEQVKVLENETEIQRSVVIHKDRCVRAVKRKAEVYMCERHIDKVKNTFWCRKMRHTQDVRPVQYHLAALNSHHTFSQVVDLHLIFLFCSRTLTKARMKLSNSCKVRDKLQNSISKVAPSSLLQADVLKYRETVVCRKCWACWNVLEMCIRVVKPRLAVEFRRQIKL